MLKMADITVEKEEVFVTKGKRHHYNVRLPQKARDELIDFGEVEIYPGHERAEDDPITFSVTQLDIRGHRVKEDGRRRRRRRRRRTGRRTGRRRRRRRRTGRRTGRG
jgi:hypothetical protein